MVRYSREPDDPTKGKSWLCLVPVSPHPPRPCTSPLTHPFPSLSVTPTAAKARGSHLRVHFKHVREVAHTISGWQVGKAKTFLNDVLQYKRAVPFTRFTQGVGRHAQAKLLSVPGSQCAWPQKATKVVLDMLTNAESNAEVKGLDPEALYITHAQTNRAPKQRRRTYRAHGRINPYMSSPAHLEIHLEEKPVPVKKEAGPVKLTRKQAARVRVGGGN